MFWKNDNNIPDSSAEQAVPESEVIPTEDDSLPNDLSVEAANENYGEERTPPLEDTAVSSMENDSETFEYIVAEALVPTAETSAAEGMSAEAPPSAVPACAEEFGVLKTLMEKLLSEFSGKLKYDVKKQEQIDQLYKENLSFRDGLVEQCKKKLTLAVIEQIDDAEKQIAHFQNAEYSEENFRKILHSFQDVALSFRDMLLERFDIESWRSESDTPFDPRRQRTLRTTPTAEPERVKTIRQSIRFGYQANEGQILRPEMVDVYVFDASAASPTSEVLPELIPENEQE